MGRREEAGELDTVGREYQSCDVKEVQCADVHPFEGLGFNLAPGEVATFCAAKIPSSELVRR